MSSSDRSSRYHYVQPARERTATVPRPRAKGSAPMATRGTTAAEVEISASTAVDLEPEIQVVTGVVTLPLPQAAKPTKELHVRGLFEMLDPDLDAAPSVPLRPTIDMRPPASVAAFETEPTVRFKRDRAR